MIILLEMMLQSEQLERTEMVSDFRRLQPLVFYGIVALLKAEQWIVDMENFLKSARIPKENQAEVVCIQLTYVTRTW